MKYFLSLIKKFADKVLDPRKYVIALCGLFAGLCLLAALFTFVVDPYVYYHRPWVKPLYTKSYAMVPGLLRHEAYDTVLFGSSISQNFLLSDLDKLYNGTSIKATSPGLPAEALGQYITLALQKDSFRHAIVAIDLMAFAKDPKTSPRLQYDYLYQGSLFPVKYLLSNDSLTASFKLLRGNFKQLFSEETVEDMDRDFMFGWHKKSSKARLEAGIREAKRLELSPPAVPSQAEEYMETHLFAHIKNNPEITFDLFLPPYHIYFWCTLQSVEKAEGYLKLREYFVARAQDFPNVKLHDFQAEEKIVCNMEIFRDGAHYNKETNALMAQEMKKGSYLIDREAGERNTAKLRALIARYLPEYQKL